jgi:hypothetical protein
MEKAEGRDEKLRKKESNITRAKKKTRIIISEKIIIA